MGAGADRRKDMERLKAQEENFQRGSSWGCGWAGKRLSVRTSRIAFRGVEGRKQGRKPRTGREQMQGTVLIQSTAHRGTVFLPFFAKRKRGEGDRQVSPSPPPAREGSPRTPPRREGFLRF